MFGGDPGIKGKGKPDPDIYRFPPDIYLLALEKINNSLSDGEMKIHPQECLVWFLVT